MSFTWNNPVSGTTELLVGFDRARSARLLVLPAWFDEANKLRRFTLAVMRQLDGAGIDSLLPDLPGCNESLVPLSEQTLDGWRQAAAAAAGALGATHVLAIRAGALLAPPALPGWHYAAQGGPKLLRGMLRARVLAAREAGIAETSEELVRLGRETGLTLGGWLLGPALVRALESAEPALAPGQSDIAPSELGGPGLWLRAEPGEDPSQAARLAAIIAETLGDSGA